ncbi:MAG: Fic family protein [Desulfovermiculus sp.]|nr:Fic family protein [Desulfovermiculus sp.]
MKEKEEDIEPAARQAEDRGERIALIEPLLIREDSRHRNQLIDLVMDLARQASGFRRSLPEGIVRAWANLVRAMNCYYSNLIEGHYTHPVDIERALKGDYSNDVTKRNLQLEAKAHIAVQEWIDGGGLSGRAVTVNGLCEIHRRFCQLLPEALLWVEHPKTGSHLPVIPGELRSYDVQIGHHVPISPGALPRFLARFEDFYGQLGRTDSVLAAACAHHRLLWIHPFLDGNGRVTRMMSYALLLEHLKTGGIWSVARGLARNEAEYKQKLMACDMKRGNDLDGRGHLSEDALAEFAGFFLRVCLDQIDFMEELVQPSRLRERLFLWAGGEIRAGTLPPKADRVLEAILYQGEFPRGEVPGLLGVSERQARRITSSLLNHEIVTSDSNRAPLRLSFPARLAPHLMPGLFPDH